MESAKLTVEAKPNPECPTCNDTKKVEIVSNGNMHRGLDCHDCVPRTFVYQIERQPKRSLWITSNHVYEERYGKSSVFGTYATIEQAVKQLAEIYEKGHFGVRHNTEYLIVKREVTTSRLIWTTHWECMNCTEKGIEMEEVSA